MFGGIFLKEKREKEKKKKRKKEKKKKRKKEKTTLLSQSYSDVKVYGATRRA
ncbi:MAG: hypothetical protein LBD73_03695 [Deferribacteraceae bacterium]|nr:hypothetical protein [Deferribacteraceae bacterium]